MKQMTINPYGEPAVVAVQGQRSSLLERKIRGQYADAFAYMGHKKTGSSYGITTSTLEHPLESLSSSLTINIPADIMILLKKIQAWKKSIPIPLFKNLIIFSGLLVITAVICIFSVANLINLPKQIAFLLLIASFGIWVTSRVNIELWRLHNGKHASAN